MVDVNALNPQQQEAVRLYRGPVMILAGAGTGKTRVVTTRIAYMLSQGVLPRQIAAMTFTNKAAREMRERLSHLVGAKQAQDLSVGTFHSFCLKILRTWPKAVGLLPKFSLVGTSDQLDLVRRALTDKGWHGLYRPEDFHYQIGQCKNYLLSPADVAAGQLPPCGVPDPEVLAHVYALYESQLQLNRAIDFDDCIVKVVQLLRHSPDFAVKLRERYRYLLVDEFQDTNASQFAVLEELAKGENNICVVGDDDQSIYSWRGAMFETLERFEKTFAGTRIIKLEQNYRCSNVILNAANALIAHNSQRKEKKLWSQSQVQKPIILAGFEDAEAEARWIATKCLSLLGRGFAAKDIAILYRANAQAKALELALREASLPFKTYGGQSFFERKEVKDFLAYLRLVLNPNDHLALWRIINHPPRGIGLKTQEQVEGLAKRLQLAPFVALMHPECREFLTASMQEAVAKFVDLIAGLRSLPLSTPGDCAQLGEQILSRTALLQQLSQAAKNIQSRQHKRNNLQSLPLWLENAAKEAEQHGEGFDAAKLLDSLSLGDEQKFKKEEANPQHISLMTIHAAKGLEYPAVFVVGLEEGSLPHKNSLEEAQGICEERRLLYVALTRAKQELFLTHAYLRQTSFQKENRKKSRFLKELPADSATLVELGSQQLEEKKPADLRQATISKLALLKANFLKDK